MSYALLSGSTWSVKFKGNSAGVYVLQAPDLSTNVTVNLPTTSGTLLIDTTVAGVNAMTQTTLAAGFRQLDALALPFVTNMTTTTPPASPSNGDTYIVGTAATGAWSGKDGQFTRFSDAVSAWEFYVPKNGWLIFNRADSTRYLYNGSAWVVYGVSDSLVVHLAGTETVTGTKNFTGLVTTKAIQFKQINSQGGAYTIVSTDYMVRYTGAGAQAFTLPAATGSGQVLVLKNKASAAVTLTINRAGSDTIDGATSIALTQFQTATLVDTASGVWDRIV